MSVLIHPPADDARTRASAPARSEPSGHTPDDLTTREILLSDLATEDEDVSPAERARRRAAAYLERRRRRLQADLVSRG